MNEVTAQRETIETFEFALMHSFSPERFAEDAHRARAIIDAKLAARAEAEHLRAELDIANQELTRLQAKGEQFQLLWVLTMILWAVTIIAAFGRSN